MANLAGINLAMQTTFDERGEIDYVAFETLIDQYIEAGVHGLVLGAGTGQHPYLTEAECNKLYEVGIQRINGRVNVICQTSALNIDEVVRRSKHAERIGADALMVLPPYLEGPSDDDSLFEFYREIDEAVNIDIIGYNIPYATQISISPQLLDRLQQLKNFNYIKDSSGDFTVQQQYLQSGGGVLNGGDTLTLYAFLAGTKGAIWGLPTTCHASRLIFTTSFRKSATTRPLLCGAACSLLCCWCRPPTIFQVCFTPLICVASVRAICASRNGASVSRKRRCSKPLLSRFSAADLKGCKAATGLLAAILAAGRKR
ncbi:dihydrodipicolinate synthase family protein [Pseudomonas sp. CBSPCBW29]|nr:dihydrodipicolinate synthase family protein [Pseudomonas sp. CBSPCBW29]